MWRPAATAASRFTLIYEANAVLAFKDFTAPMYIILRGLVTGGYPQNQEVTQLPDCEKITMCMKNINSTELLLINQNVKWLHWFSTGV